MGCHRERLSLVPWWLPDSDLREANDGEAELVRDLVRNGKPERQFGLQVFGQATAPPSLGLIAIRCQRRGGTVTPLTLSIPETPMVVEAREPATVPIRVRLRTVDGATR